MAKKRTIWYQIKRFFRDIFDHDPMIITPYLSYANENKVHIKGRILEDEGFVLAEESSMFDNFMNNLKSFKSDEAKHTKVIINYKEQVIDTYTDNDGYFEVEFNTQQKPTSHEFLDWDCAEIMAPEYLDKDGHPIEAKIKILLPHQDTDYIIVSDIDDTILVTHVNSFLKLKMIINTFFKNERTRLPFDEIADVLHQLTLNKDKHPVNPIFYLSNSPWNLYNFLLNFFKFHNIPLGVVFLRDFGIKFGKAYKEFKNHKKNTLEHLLSFYDDHQFVLLGDATEGDTEIYLNMYQKYGERIKHIYIRADKAKKNALVREIIKENPHAPIHLIEHSSDILDIRKNKHMH